MASQSVDWTTAPSGLIAWNATTKTLTVSGTVYIDGSAKVSNSSVNSYNGYGVIYLSGTFRVTGTMCAAILSGACNFSGWNPDKDLLMIVANGNGGQVNPGAFIRSSPVAVAWASRYQKIRNRVSVP